MAVYYIYYYRNSKNKFSEPLQEIIYLPYRSILYEIRVFIECRRTLIYIRLFNSFNKSFRKLYKYQVQLDIISIFLFLFII